MRVLVLDDHEIVRRGLVDLISSAPDLAVVAEASTAAEPLARIPAVRPDVALLDAMLPDGNGIDACRGIRARHPEVDCLVLTTYDDEAGPGRLAPGPVVRVCWGETRRAVSRCGAEPVEAGLDSDSAA